MLIIDITLDFKESDDETRDDKPSTQAVLSSDDENTNGNSSTQAILSPSLMVLSTSSGVNPSVKPGKPAVQTNRECTGYSSQGRLFPSLMVPSTSSGTKQSVKQSKKRKGWCSRCSFY